MTICRSPFLTAGLPDCWYRICISGRALNGRDAPNLWKRIRPVFGSRWVTTSTGTPGASSVTQAMSDASPLLRDWQLATVAAIRDETPSVRTIAFSLPQWSGHLAGQHVDVRLTTDDGYQAERSYSIASPSGQVALIEITVERIADGEVSPFLTEH